MAGEGSSSGQAAGSAEVPRSAIPDVPLALYRRYRPATFADVKGQEHVTEPLRQALRSGRVHHAYLFSGPRGCGKTSSARILARSLNCAAGPTPDPCGVCESCVALAPSGPGSIDVIEIDAASHGGIDDARDLRERAFYSPVAARYKVYIIDEAHMVTGGGFNALLKLVEEPPPHLKFVFATTEPEKVIATIRSRTHHYPFRLVPPAVLRQLLEEILRAEGISYEPAVLPVVIRAGAGSVRDSLSVLDQLMAGSDDAGLRYDRAAALLGYTDDALLDEMAGAFAAADGAAVFRAIDRVVEAGHDPRRFAADLLDRLRDLIVLAAVPGAAASGLLDVPEDRLEQMRSQAAEFGQHRLVRAAEAVSNGLVEMRGATSPRLLLELTCAQVLLPAALPADGDLAARVDRLERHLTSGLAPRQADAGARTAEATGAAETPAGRPRSGAGRRTAVDSRAARQSDQAEPSRAQPSTDGARTGPSRPVGVGEGKAGGAGATPPAEHTATSAAEDQAPAAPGPPDSGLPDTATLQRRWPEVLDAVRSVSKVAWILLSGAALDSVHDGVLTLAFEREGDARGFGSSGSGDYLAKVLDSIFGVRLAIRAVVGPVTEGGGAAGGGPGDTDARSYGAGGRARRGGGRPDGGGRTHDGGDRPTHEADGGAQDAPSDRGAASGRGGTASGKVGGSGSGSGRVGSAETGPPHGGTALAAAGGDPAGAGRSAGEAGAGAEFGDSAGAASQSRVASPRGGVVGGPGAGGAGSGVAGDSGSGGLRGGGLGAGVAAGSGAGGAGLAGGPGVLGAGLAGGASATGLVGGAGAAGLGRASALTAAGGMVAAGRPGGGVAAVRHTDPVFGDDPRPLTDPDPDPQGGYSADILTGAGLIEQVLGGQVIEQIDET